MNPSSGQDLTHAALLEGVGALIRERRTARGWTLQQLAEYSSLSVRYVVDIEAGNANPSLLKLAQLAQALELSLSALFSKVEAGARHPRSVVALLGLRGAGKTTIGQRLATSLELPFFELDALIEERCGLSLTEIFALHGEGYYRRVELETLEAFVHAHSSAVLATSGGIVSSPESMALLSAFCRLVWLRAEPEDHLARVLAQGDDRPVRNRPHAMAELRALLKRREPLYARADLKVLTSKLGLEGSVLEIERWLARA